MEIVITWCEIDKGFRMKLQENDVTLWEDSELYETKVDVMNAAGHLVRNYLEMKGE